MTQSDSQRNWYKRNRNKKLEYSKKYYHKNKERRKEIHKKYRQEHKKEKWEGRLKRIYGITAENYQELLKRQSGVCAICLNQQTYRSKNVVGDSLCVDHSHRTGQVRGLLCHRCNMAIGLFEDDLLLLEKSLNYLKGK